MVPASVGFQCPDDVRAGAATVRSARTAFGGRITGSAGRLTAVLVGLNVAVYVLGLLGLSDLAYRFGNLAQAGQAGQGIGVAEGQYYRLLTAAFLHAGLLHLGSNVLALASLGPPLEQALGRARFLTLYVLSAIGGSTLSFLVSAPNQLGVGASGAVFGLLGAYYVVLRRTGGDTSQVLVLLVINLVITFAVPIIDWRAHLGGLVTGGALGAVFAYAPAGPRRPALQAAGCVAVALLLAAAVAARTVALQG